MEKINNLLKGQVQKNMQKAMANAFKKKEAITDKEIIVKGSKRNLTDNLQEVMSDEGDESPNRFEGMATPQEKLTN